MAKAITKEQKTFLNPFQSGVSYEQFLAAIPTGVTVEDYCKGELTQEQIDWLTTDLNIYKNKIKK